MKNNENRKELHIIQGPGYKYDSFIPIADRINEHFDRILSLLSISTPSGKPICIKLNVDCVNPEEIAAYAQRVSKDPSVYQIRMGAGLLYHLWVASRAFASEYNLLPWIEQCKINDERLRKLGKKQIFADYAHSIGCYYIILHEISHIVLGQLEYIKDEIELDYLSEFQDEKSQYSLEEIRISKAFEAEADRQAGEFLLVFFEQSLGSNGLGNYLSFPSRLHVYEFYVYAITIVFRMLQVLTQRQGLIHPKPNERLYTLVGSLSKYFSHNFPDEHDKIYLQAVKSCLEAGEKLLVLDSYDPCTVIQNAYNLAFVDEVIRETNIRSYQHKVEVISTK